MRHITLFDLSRHDDKKLNHGDIDHHEINYIIANFFDSVKMNDAENYESRVSV